MNRLIALSVALLFLFPTFVSAHPGRTASDNYLFCQANFDNRIVNGQEKYFFTKNDIGLLLKTKKRALRQDFIVVAQKSSFHVAYIKPGFLNGNNFRNKSNIGKLYYVMGVLDGLLAGQFLDTNDDVDWLSGCLNEMSNEQVRAIVEKYLKNHPEEWHNPMSSLVFNSIIKSCPKN